MKLRVDLDGQPYTFEFQRNGVSSEYNLQGVVNDSGVASLAEIAPGVFSVLIGSRSFTVHTAPCGDRLEVWIGAERHFLSLADARDRSGAGAKMSAAGPIQIRAQMPGKVIKLLAQVGDRVQTGRGLIVVEAMKMQNEMKSPKDGKVSKISVAEGAAVAAGETLIVVE